jgi:hypothetical protein
MDDEYYDYYRNADHRRPFLPPPQQQAAPPMPPPRPYAMQPYAQPYAQPYPPQYGRPYAPAYPPPPPPVLNRETIAKAIRIAGAVIPALLGLPQAPTVPAATGDTVTDQKNALIAHANTVTYQTSLAEHAKRDEQIRALSEAASLLIEGVA